MVKALTLAAKDFQQTSSAKQNNPVDLAAYDLILILIYINKQLLHFCEYWLAFLTPLCHNRLPRNCNLIAIYWSLIS